MKIEEPGATAPLAEPPKPAAAKDGYEMTVRWLDAKHLSHAAPTW